MNTESWTVRTPSGAELGSITKLTIDSKTSQITYVELLVNRMGHVVLLPWSLFEITSEMIVLQATEEQLAAAPILRRAAASSAPVTLGVSKTMPGRLRPNTNRVQARQPLPSRPGANEYGSNP